MRIDSATIAIEPRSVGACIDLASLFYREHAKEIFTLTVVFGVPSCLLSFWIASSSDYGLLWSAVLLFTLTPLLGSAVVSAAGRSVFGERMSARGALRALARDFLPVLLSIVTTRTLTLFAAALCFGLPAPFVAVFYGFSSEVLLLEQLRGSRARERLVELVKHTYFELVLRMSFLFLFASVVVVSLFVLVDQTTGSLFGLPILFGRASSSYAWTETWQLVAYDPWVVATVSGLVWIVYPLARLGWFFCYLDTRIRKEGWDVELAFRVEARRLESLA